jgi:Tol biopolymer transport system component
VEAVVMRGLEKLPADRFRSAAEFGNALSDSGFRHRESREPTPRVDRWKVASALLAAIALALFTWIVRSGGTGLNYYNLALPLGEAASSRVALSPDGTRYVFVGSGLGLQGGALWIRHQSRARPELLAELSGAGHPAFSPDGQSVAALEYLGGGRSALVRVPLDGSGTVPIAEGELDRMGHSWGDDGYMYIGSTRGTLRVPEAGGEFELVTRVDSAAGETGHHSPVILPGGEGVVFTVRYTPFRETGLYRIAVAGTGGGAHRILTSGVRAEYAAPGVLLHVSAEGGLFATPFDPERLELTGQTTPIADDLSVGAFGVVDLAVSHTGTLAYGPVSTSPAAFELVEVSRDGTSRPLDPGWTEDFRFLSVSPDGSRLLVETGPSGTPDGRAAVWVWSFDRGTRNRLTTEEGIVMRPVWTPDGARIGFLSGSLGTTDLWTMRPDGSDRPELVLDHEVDIAETAWSKDGRWLVYRTTSVSTGGGDIWLRDVERETEQALFDAEFDETSPSLSPDGRWIAYTFAPTGDPDVWVASFPDVRQAREKISEGGGTEPRWSRDGRELFYRDGNDDMVAVEAADSSELTFTAPRRLFSASTYRAQRFHFGYDVMPNGDAFVMIRGTAFGQGSQVVVIEDFRRLLDR